MAAMTNNVAIRSADPEDAGQLLGIYRPFVEHTVVSFELSVPSLADFQSRITQVCSRWCWLVAQVQGEIIGYAYGSAHRPREAYRYSVETSAYIHPQHQRQGIAALLYKELFTCLAAQGYANAYAGIALPNDASVAFHQHAGFNPVGVFPRVGYKFNQWHDVAWMHRPLTSDKPDRPVTSDNGRAQSKNEHD